MRSTDRVHELLAKTALQVINYGWIEAQTAVTTHSHWEERIEVVRQVGRRKRVGYRLRSVVGEEGGVTGKGVERIWEGIEMSFGDVFRRIVWVHDLLIKAKYDVKER